MGNLSSWWSGFLSSILSDWYPERDSPSEDPEASTCRGITAQAQEREFSSESSQGSTSSGINLQARQVNESIYELDTPPSNPSMQLLFFHGLQFANYENAHLSTWESGDGSCIWPQKWLLEEFPGARVLYVSYDGRVGKSFDGSVFEMNIIAENLTSDLIQANIGQVRGSPVILVGHSLGGLVIKRVCYQAHEMLNVSEGLGRAKLQTFLDNLRGIFFYATPHRGIPVAENAIDLYGGPLLEYFKILSKETARLNDKFDKLSRMYPNWRMEGVGESNPTKWGTGREFFIVPEASARQYDFNIVDGTDHFTISKPMTTSTRSFYKLKDLLSSIANNMKDEGKPEVGNLQYVPKSIIGIRITVQEIKRALVNVSTLGLVGMGGVGKTTLAKAVFNALCPDFEYSCFVDNVKQKGGDVNDIKGEVWKLMYCKDKKVGDRPDWSRLSGRLLLVLDDISNDGRDESVLSEIRDATASESRFIVTSREEDVVKSLGEIYEVPFLNEDMALEVFKSHAFPNKEISQPLEFHMETIVKKCEGLPLTLEVLGKHLKGKTDETYWKQTLQALVEADDVTPLNNRLWAKLKPSYNDLGDQEQQMFLDATTFFSGDTDWTLFDAKAAWRVAYGSGVETLQWQTLVDRSLVYNVDDHENIKVHEQLQSLGRKIACEASNNGRWRVWDGELGFQMLQSTAISDGKEFYALRVEYPQSEDSEEYEDRGEEDVGSEEHDENDSEISECINVSSNARLKLKKLHFLEVNIQINMDGAKEDGAFPTELVLLKCIGQNIFDPALQSHLAVLSISSLEYLPDSIRHLSYLDRLTIRDSPLLCFLPESFGKLSSLRRLELLECRSLGALPESFGKLKALERVTLKGCKFQSLPESFGRLSSLNRLEFHHCDNLHTLPDSFGGLSSLNELEFCFCDNLHTLPDSFGRLSSLSHLQFKYCHNLHTLPHSFGGLSSLNRLIFCLCPELQALLDSFGRLSSLSHLEFKSCDNLHTLPDSFGGLSSLNRLDFDLCKNLHTLPDSFGRLSSLSHVDFDFCENLHTLPDSFGRLSSLSHLRFTYCKNLHTLPDSFGRLSSLSHLQFRHCHNLHTLPDSFGRLSSLNELQFLQCDNLHSLPDSFGRLSCLNKLQFLHCDNLHSLPDSFGRLSSLNELQFLHCNNLHSLPDSFGRLSSLSRLRFDECDNLHSLPDSFGGLSSLKYLQLRLCHNLHSLPDSLGQLKALDDLILSQCRALEILPKSMGKLNAVRHVAIFECGIKSLPDTFSHLCALNVLDTDCELESSWEPLGQLTKRKGVDDKSLCGEDTELIGSFEGSPSSGN